MTQKRIDLDTWTPIDPTDPLKSLAHEIEIQLDIIDEAIAQISTGTQSNGNNSEQGPAGQDGKDGKDGANGADGLPGINGKDGEPGLPGKDGAQGIQGVKGETGATGAQGPAGVGLKGFASAYVNAGTFVTLDNLKFSVTTGGQRGLCCATVSGSVTVSISANYALCGGANGGATQWPGATYTTTPSGSWFGWSFSNAGDGSTYLVNDYTNQRFYRVTLMIGYGYNNNFISVERLI
jgi:hypothetical protein